MAICCLHTDVVYKPFSGNLVVRLQDVMQMLDGALEVADVHISGKGRHLDKLAIVTIVEGFAFDQCLRTFLMTMTPLDYSR